MGRSRQLEKGNRSFEERLPSELIFDEEHIFRAQQPVDVA